MRQVRTSFTSFCKAARFQWIFTIAAALLMMHFPIVMAHSAVQAIVVLPTPTGKPHICLPDKWYPRSAVRTGEQGQTVVMYEIGPDGLVRDTTVAKSAGSNDLDAAALQCVSEFRYIPASMNGQPTATVWVSVIRWCLSAHTPPACSQPSNESGVANWPKAGAVWDRIELGCNAGLSVSLTKDSDGAAIIRLVDIPDVRLDLNQLATFNSLAARATLPSNTSPAILSCENNYLQQINAFFSSPSKGQ